MDTTVTAPPPRRRHRLLVGGAIALLVVGAAAKPVDYWVHHTIIGYPSPHVVVPTGHSTHLHPVPNPIVDPGAAPTATVTTPTVPQPVTPTPTPTPAPSSSVPPAPSTSDSAAAAEAAAQDAIRREGMFQQFLNNQANTFCQGQFGGPC